MKLIFITLCAFLVVFHVNASFQSPTAPHPQAKKDFTFYVFTSEWAGSVCSINSCSKAYSQGVKPDFWNIHGLWPSDGKRGINYCSDEKFDPNQITTLKSDLISYWSGLYSSADGFHGHEWQAHGTCSNMSQIDYFSAVIKLAKQMNVYAALQKHKIVPGTQAYTCDQVAQAIHQEYGVTNFTLQITSGYLMALELCVNKNLQVQNCPQGQKICKGNVKYPVLNL